MPPAERRRGDDEDSISGALVGLLRTQTEAMQETGKELASLRAEVAALKESLRACPAADAGRVGDQVARLAERVEALERAITRYVGPVAVAGVLLAMGLSVGPRVVAALLGAGAP